MRKLLDPDDEDEEPDMPNDPDSGKKHHHRRPLLDPDDEDEEPDMPNDPDSGKKRRLLADAECQRVCKKVPIKSVTTKCEHKVKKVTTCKTVNEADCLKVSEAALMPGRLNASAYDCCCCTAACKVDRSLKFSTAQQFGQVCQGTHKQLSVTPLKVGM
jgi:hypothetical protein